MGNSLNYRKNTSIIKIIFPLFSSAVRFNHLLYFLMALFSACVMSSGLNPCPAGTYFPACYDSAVFLLKSSVKQVAWDLSAQSKEFFVVLFLKVLHSNLRNKNAPFWCALCYKHTLFIIKYRSLSCLNVQAPGLTGPGQPGSSSTTWSAYLPSFRTPAQFCLALECFAFPGSFPPPCSGLVLVLCLEWPFSWTNLTSLGNLISNGSFLDISSSVPVAIQHTQGTVNLFQLCMPRAL